MPSFPRAVGVDPLGCGQKRGLSFLPVHFWRSQAPGVRQGPRRDALLLLQLTDHLGFGKKGKTGERVSEEGGRREKEIGERESERGNHLRRAFFGRGWGVDCPEEAPFRVLAAVKWPGRVEAGPGRGSSFLGRTSEHRIRHVSHSLSLFLSKMLFFFFLIFNYRTQNE